MISRIRASPRYLSDFNYEEKTETKNRRKASILSHPGFQHCHLQVGPCSPPGHTPWDGGCCASQAPPKGWEPRLPVPKKPHSPATLDPIQRPALVVHDPTGCCPPAQRDLATAPHLSGAAQSWVQRGWGTVTARVSWGRSWGKRRQAQERANRTGALLTQGASTLPRTPVVLCHLPAVPGLCQPLLQPRCSRTLLSCRHPGGTGRVNAAPSLESWGELGGAHLTSLHGCGHIWWCVLVVLFKAVEKKQGLSLHQGWNYISYHGTSA